MTKAGADVTELLRRFGAGDEDAAGPLMDAVYRELRKIAQNHFRRERHDHTLEPTALVHELYGRLAAQHAPWQSRGHFYAIASRMMRRLLVNHARARRAGKRAALHVTLGEGPATRGGLDVDMLALDDAMKALAERYPRECRTVELRYFAGLTEEETAEALGVSTGTVKRDWRFARSWLRRRLEA